MQHEFRGKALTVIYDDAVCAHAARCVNELPAVFDANRTPWVDPDGATAEQIAAQVARCPSSALRIAAPA